MSTLRCFALVVVILVTTVASAYAAVPPMMSYQGKLMQPSGAPVPDGSYSLQFAVYDVPTGGTALWSETNPGVQVKGGLFSVLLGSVNNLPGNIFDNPSRFFGVKVGADPEMIPRQQIASSAFAFRSATAGTVDDAAITEAKLANGAVTTDKVSNGGITATKLAIGVATPASTISMFGGSATPTGWLLCDGAAVSRTLYADLFAAIGSAYGPGDGATTFNLPDFRGVFPKGAGTTGRTAGKDASGNWYSGALGAYAQDQMQGHYHDVSGLGIAEFYPGADDQLGGTFQCRVTGSRAYILSPSSDGTNGAPRTGHTTEPQSLGVNYIIKY